MATKEEALQYLAVIHRFALTESIDTIRQRLLELHQMLYDLDEMPIVEARRGELRVFNIQPTVAQRIIDAGYYCAQEGVGGQHSTDLSFPHNTVVRLPDGTRLTRFGNIIRSI